MVAAMVSGPAIAQNMAGATGPDDRPIIVTAQKREQILDDVPASIGVILSHDIAETGKDGFADFINTVPGLSVASGGPGYSTLAIRGITTGRVRQDEPQNKETVGLYLDDAPVSVNGFDPDLSLFDVARIEVLRGPQGTLFGSGSLGGSIRIITNRPDTGTVEGHAEGTISETRHGGTDHVLRGMMNLPLAQDTVALRATAYRSRLSGYIDDTATGRQNVNDSRTQGARVQLGARLGARLDAKVAFFVQDLRTGSRSEQFAPYERGVRAFDGNSDNLKLYSGTLNFDLDGAKITSATSYLDKRNINRLSLEFLLSAALGMDSPSPIVDTTHVKDFTQEVRIASDGEGRLQYVFGLFFQHHKRAYSQIGNVPGLDDYVGVAATDFGTSEPDQIFYSTQDIEQRQFAGFGELSFELVEGLKATAGLRVFRFREKYATYSAGLLNGGADASAGRTSESGVTPKFALSFRQNEDRLFYLLASKGFRLGGVNTTIPVDLCSADLNALGRKDRADRFKSDNVWNYEVGAKLRSSDRSFAINASAYYIEWKDMQTTLTLPSCFFAFRTNAGKARSIGGEIEFLIWPSQRTEFHGSLGLSDSRLSRDIPFTSWEKGDRVPYVSPVQINLGVRQEFDFLAGAASFVRADYTYVSKARSNFNAQDPANRFLNDYSLISLTLGMQIPGTPLELVLFARNLADSRGRVAAFEGNTVAPERYVTVRPRTIGATLRAAY